MWLDTPKGRASACAALLAFRAQHGRCITLVRNVASDGAFNWSAWRGTEYVGAIAPKGLA